MNSLPVKIVLEFNNGVRMELPQRIDDFTGKDWYHYSIAVSMLGKANSVLTPEALQGIHERAVQDAEDALVDARIMSTLSCDSEGRLSSIDGKGRSTTG